MLGKVFGEPVRTSTRIGAGLCSRPLRIFRSSWKWGIPPMDSTTVAPPRLCSRRPTLRGSQAKALGSVSHFHFRRSMFRRAIRHRRSPGRKSSRCLYDFSFDNRNKLPYSEHYELSIQHQVRSNSVVTASYVGNQGHHLVTSVEANPTNQALCLAVHNSTAPGDPTCDAFSETPPFTVTVQNGQSIGTTTPWQTRHEPSWLSTCRPLGPICSITNSRRADDCQFSLQRPSAERLPQ